MTVVLPTRDRPRLTLRAVRSVLAQSRTDLELIVVDDGSAEPVSSLLARKVRDDRLRCLRLSESGGASAARNAGVEQASGRYVAFLDSDDVWLEDRLHNAISDLEDERNPIALHCGSFWVQRQRRPARGVPGVVRGRALERLLTQRGGPLTTSTFVTTRETFAAGVAFDPKMPALQDLDFAVQVAQRGAIVGSSRITAIKYPQSDDKRVYTYANELAARKLFVAKYEQLLMASAKAWSRQQQAVASGQVRTGDHESAERTLEEALARQPIRASTRLLRSALRLGPSAYLRAERALKVGDSHTVYMLATRYMDMVHPPQLSHTSPGAYEV